MRVVLLIVVLLANGCNKAIEQTLLPSQPTLQTAYFDEVLSKTEFAGTIEHAEHDLASDVWVNMPRRVNVTRTDRESAVAAKILEDVRPKLQRMSVPELVRAMKLVPYGNLTSSFTGVAYFVYRDGNRMIINEIRARPTRELQSLPNLANDKMEGP